MPASNQHIIQKVNASLTVGKHEKANARSERLKVAVERAVNRLAPVLDTVPDDIMLFVDQVTVHITLDELDPDQLEEEISVALAEKLRHVIHARRNKSETEAGAGGTFSEEEQHRKVLAFFLKKGRTPWWASSQVLARAMDYLDSLSASDWVHFIRSQNRESPLVIKRYVNQWPENSVLGTIKKIVKERFGSESIVDLLNGLLAFDKLKRPAYRGIDGVGPGIYERVLEDLISNKGEHQIAADMIQSWLQNSGSEPNQNREQLNELKKFLKRQKLLSHGLKEALEKAYHQKLPDDTAESEAGEKVGENEDKSFATDEKESVPVQNAGIVILHSYLPRLFSRLGYLENGEFRNQATRERAVCALHFLATGGSEFPEEELVLAKFLCGWPQDEPISRYLDFSDYEREECERLLSGVISHWKALKNTSINGLRSSFFQREGILKKEAFGYTLYVEEFTHDILLQRLPWSISVVKLTWMDEMLTVQWRF